MNSEFQLDFKGFTLIELLVVIAIIAVLASFTILNLNLSTILEDSRRNTTRATLREIAKAATVFAARNGYYPPDEDRNIPTAFIEYMGPSAWANGPFPGSVYDWDNWENATCWDGSTGIIQVTLRDINDYQGYENYTIYYVIQGEGIPHCNQSTVRGECVNCPDRYPAE